MDEALNEAIATAVGSAVAAATAVPGGDLNDGWRVDLADGRRLFVKTAADAPPGGYTAEAAGLRWLAEPGTLAVAEPVAVVDSPAGEDAVRLLALAWIEPGRLDAAGEETLGRGLAQLHAAGAPRFGAFGADPAEPLRIGPLELPNGPAA
ncbi:MAG: phosphotransferase, partial [Solirubrobacterales bacterium]|nr:phosphotransferase [Solirubrobacterales bacterium]